MKKARSTLMILSALLVAACGDEGPTSGPGTLTATLVGPNGAEGAALVILVGEGLGAISPIGDTEAFARNGPASARIVLVNQAGGTLSFQFEVADTTVHPGFVVQEVAGPDDEMRATLDGYSVEISR